MSNEKVHAVTEIPETPSKRKIDKKKIAIRAGAAVAGITALLAVVKLSRPREEEVVEETTTKKTKTEAS